MKKQFLFLLIISSLGIAIAIGLFATALWLTPDPNAPDEVSAKHLNDGKTHYTMPSFVPTVKSTW